MNCILDEFEQSAELGDKYIIQRYNNGIEYSSGYISNIVKVTKGAFILFDTGDDELLIETVSSDVPQIWKLLFTEEEPTGQILHGQISSLSFNGCVSDVDFDNKLFNWISQDNNIFYGLMNMS